jgi:hypothetical protein
VCVCACACVCVCVCVCACNRDRERESEPLLKVGASNKCFRCILHGDFTKANFAMLMEDNYDDDNYFDRKMTNCQLGHALVSLLKK